MNARVGDHQRWRVKLHAKEARRQLESAVDLDIVDHQLRQVVVQHQRHAPARKAQQAGSLGLRLPEQRQHRRLRSRQQPQRWRRSIRDIGPSSVPSLFTNNSCSWSPCFSIRIWCRPCSSAIVPSGRLRSGASRASISPDSAVAIHLLRVAAFLLRLISPLPKERVITCGAGAVMVVLTVAKALRTKNTLADTDVSGSRSPRFRMSFPTGLPQDKPSDEFYHSAGGEAQTTEF